MQACKARRQNGGFARLQWSADHTARSVSGWLAWSRGPVPQVGVDGPVLDPRPVGPRGGLVNAKVGSLVDDRRSWPQLLNVDGMTYGDLTPMSARERLDWLKRSVRTVGYSPQPYEQLAAYYRR